MIRGDPAAPALIGADGDVLSYAVLSARVEQTAAFMRPGTLLLLVGGNDIDTLVHYLAALEARTVPLLLGSTIARQHAQRLIELYQPDFVFAHADVRDLGPGYCKVGRGANPALYKSMFGEQRPLHPDLALLLPTSGSTGSPKLVRLSHRNLTSNAESIAAYLGIGPGERAITTLPYHYSYGLSVINSHLHAGATVVLNDRSLVDRAFWDLLRREQASSLAGVPYTYEILLRLGLERLDMPSVRTMTQAGGKLADARTLAVGRACAARGIRFFSMYGQTEATARIAYLEPEHLESKLGSIGHAIPGGSLSLRDDAGALITEANKVGELVYAGPNVSLGYAQCRDDLTHGDENQGALATGDLARVDDDGFYFLVGRKSRFLKIFGVRISTEDVERVMADMGFEAAAGGNDDRLKIAVVCSPVEDLGALRDQLALTLSVSASGLSIQRLEAIPRLESGKVDYAWINRTL